jgi:hypothetical protein
MRNSLKFHVKMPSSPMQMTTRLPLTYAGIALLVAVSLGLVLLMTLQNYYRAQEINYSQR